MSNTIGTVEFSYNLVNGRRQLSLTAVANSVEAVSTIYPVLLAAKVDNLETFSRDRHAPTWSLKVADVTPPAARSERSILRRQILIMDYVSRRLGISSGVKVIIPRTAAKQIEELAYTVELSEKYA